MNTFAQNLQTLANNPAFGIALTLLAYQLGVILQKKCNNSLVHPMPIAAIIIILILHFTKIPFQSYDAGASMLSFLLGPATVALAIPLCREIKVLVKHWPAVVSGVLISSFTGVLSAFWIANLLKATPDVVLSLMPKSVTTPIALVISSDIGGIPALTAGIVILTGIIGALISPLLFKALGIQNHISRGLALGAAAHVFGTTKAMQESRLSGAMGGISIVLVGFMTAVITPAVVKMVEHL